MKSNLTILLAVILWTTAPDIFPQGDFYQTPEIYTTRQGLSNTRISSIIQDERGYIWIGTEDGLNRFDGFSFTVYKHNEDDTTSLASNHIMTLFIDSHQRFWIGTIKGLQYYDPLSDKFMRASLNQPNNILRENQCNKIFEDSHCNLWVTSFNQGVVRYSMQTGESKLFTPIQESPDSSLCSRYITSITEDKSGKIWFGSHDKGISVFDPETWKFQNFHVHNSNLPADAVFDLNCLFNGDILIATVGAGVGFYRFNEKTFFFANKAVGKTLKAYMSSFCAIQNSNGDLFAGTEGRGMMKIDPTHGYLEDFPVFREQKNEIGDSKVHCLYEDKNGNIWIGMPNKGVCIIRKNLTGIRFYRKIYNEPNSLSSGNVTGIATDTKGNTWFSTDGGGIIRYHQSSKQYHHYRHDPKQSHSVSDDVVVNVYCDSKGRIWAGTYTGGLCLYNSERDDFATYKNDETDNSLPYNYAKSIVEDNQGQLWIGTNGGGLSCLNPENGRFVNYSSEKYSDLASDYIHKIFIDKKNILWIGTITGLSSLDLKSGKFYNYTHDPALGKSAIFAISEDDKGKIWIGTSNGLKFYDAKEESFQNCFPSDDNFNPVINGIIPFGEQLWLSTNKEIVCYLPEEGKVGWFSQNIGITHEFFSTSYYISPEGEIFFGGNEGCYSLYPWKVKTQLYTPTVYLSGLKIFEKPVLPLEKIDGKIILKHDISNTDRIVLQHSQKSFTIEFTAPDTPFPAFTFFSCKLDGFDNNWTTYENKQRSVTYTNLDPGTYTFHVRASNIPDTWGNSDTQLVIEILSPVWATWWAKLLYVITLLASIYFIIRMIIIRLRDKNDLKIERLKVKQQEELSQTKMQFFTNITHEFRSPLTLIIGPLEQMLTTEDDQEKKQKYKLMLKSSNKLLLLINQILDLRKAENEKMRITAHQIDLVYFTKDCMEAFTDLAKRKNISFTYDHHPDAIIAWFDPDLLDKCIGNLLSNAFKFTPENGKIEVTVQQESNGLIEIKVLDSGRGMSDEEQKHIFERFYQRDNDHQISSGIGLHLVKNIVERHKGDIRVESMPGKGSSFSIFIRQGKAHFDPEEISEFPMIQPPKTDATGKFADYLSPPDSYDDDKPLILLVEDDKDMGNFICSGLVQKYRVTKAANGKEALELIKQRIPDLVITDVMMPEMNGIELCRIIKERMDLNHIPVIMLTALGEEHRIEGLETGADSYIAKPFQFRHLLIRIEKLLELRKKMKERFSRILNLEAEQIDVTNTDEVLLQKAIEYIRTHISNPDMSVEELGKALNMSRTNLHRKLKTITGLSPIDLIKSIRMKQAAYYLSTGKMSISEVAYKVGYNTPSYFSSSFSAFFNISPTTYLKQHSLQENDK